MDAQLRDLIVVLLTLWPAVVILRRLGLNPLFALLLFLSLVIPMLGQTAVALYAVSRKWPALPMVHEKRRVR